MGLYFWSMLDTNGLFLKVEEHVNISATTNKKVVYLR